MNKDTRCRSHLVQAASTVLVRLSRLPHRRSSSRGRPSFPASSWKSCTSAQSVSVRTTRSDRTVGDKVRTHSPFNNQISTRSTSVARHGDNRETCVLLLLMPAYRMHSHTIVTPNNNTHLVCSYSPLYASPVPCQTHRSSKTTSSNTSPLRLVLLNVKHSFLNSSCRGVVPLHSTR